MTGGNSVIEKLLNPIKTKPNAPIPYVQLRKWAVDKTAVHIARIALDLYAMNAYTSIHSRSFSPIDGGGQTTWAYPPVQGVVDWGVEYIEAGDIIYITKILSCSGAFPFTNLLYGRDNDGRGPSFREIPLKKQYVPKTPIPRVWNTPSINPKSPPNRRLLTAKLELKSEVNPFPGLKNCNCKKIEKLEIADPTLQRILQFTGEEIIDQFSTGSIGFLDEKTIAEIEISLAPIDPNKAINEKGVKQLHESFDTFLEAIALLSKFGFSTEFLVINPPKSKVPQGLFVNIIPINTDNEKHSWIYLPKSERGTTNDSKIKPFLLCQVIFEGKILYIVEFLQRKNSTVVTMILGAINYKMDNKDLLAEIALFTRNRSKWRKNSSLKITDRIEHSDGETAEDWASRLKDKLLIIFKAE